MAETKLEDRGKIAIQPADQLMINLVSGMCAKCHDPDNDPHFDFPTYWPKVNHSGLAPPGGWPAVSAEAHPAAKHSNKVDPPGPSRGVFNSGEELVPANGIAAAGECRPSPVQSTRTHSDLRANLRGSGELDEGVEFVVRERMAERTAVDPVAVRSPARSGRRGRPASAGVGSVPAVSSIVNSVPISKRRARSTPMPPADTSRTTSGHSSSVSPVPP